MRHGDETRPGRYTVRYYWLLYCDFFTGELLNNVGIENVFGTAIICCSTLPNCHVDYIKSFNTKYNYDFLRRPYDGSIIFSTKYVAKNISMKFIPEMLWFEVIFLTRGFIFYTFLQYFFYIPIFIFDMFQFWKLLQYCKNCKNR